jgi:hypothetical protein
MTLSPTPTAKSRREALLRELRTGRKIPAYEMSQLAGPQYNRAIHELRWNVNGCVRPDCPKGLEFGLNIQNNNPDPRRPDHTDFWLADGHWRKPVRAGSKATRWISREVRDAIARDSALEERRNTATPFGDISPDRSYAE